MSNLLTTAFAAALAAVLVPCPGLGAQQWTVRTAAGTSFEGTLDNVEAGGAWTFTVADGTTRTVAADQILGVHGAPPRPQVAGVVRLVGGQQMCGVLRAGDPGGETLVLESPVFGRVPVYVDRLREVQFRATPSAPFLKLPSGVDGDEVLFVAVGGGTVDTLVGTVYQFAERGLLFARATSAAADSPDRFDYRDLVGLAVAGGLGPDGASEAGEADGAAVWLLTRNGDRVRARLTGGDDQLLDFALEGGREARVPVGEVASIDVDGPGRIHLSELQPVEVRERACADGTGGPLHPWARDRAAVTGGFLASGGRTFARGLGVHSRSVLTFRVPEGAAHFHSWVGFDQDATALRLRPDVDVRVTVDGEERFEWQGMRGGDPPRNVGLVAVTPGARMTLEVDFGKGLDLGDRVHWLGAMFLPATDG